MAVSLVRRRFTADEYHRMAQAGVLTEDDRVELLEGEIVEMTPKGTRHAACVRRLDHLLSAAARGNTSISVQNPIRLAEHSEPQPDLALLRPRADFYADAHPGPEDILLVVEVADATADYDRTVKVPLYARAGIAEVWLVDLAGGQVEVYRSPSTEGYREMRGTRRGEALTPQALPGTKLHVDEVLG
ncbi:MAG: Uma2 family endonuclease [Chloroflexi bacterium]|nr:Uma2 family endonuclease [Chloroflexota bacterium]